MARFQLIFFVCLVLLSTATFAFQETEMDWAEKMRKLKTLADEHNLQESIKLQQRTTGTECFNISFACEPKPQSVHELRPRDIDVIGAMGDSLTAANGGEADTIVGVAREYRGMSWIVGGEGNVDNTLTLPNIIRLFNPAVKGYSVGKRFEDGRDWWFNVAAPGARARDMPGQARALVNAMKNDERTNFENDWKLVTIFIGGNDLCALKSSDGRPDKYIEYLREALDILHNNLPRTMVNVIEILEIYLLSDVGNGNGSTAVCRIAQRALCGYIVKADEEELEIIKEENRLYQTLTQDLIHSGRYDTRYDFTVVLQPFFRDTVLPLTEDGFVDSTYFAPDCFHFGAKAHAMGALNLWNNMLEPVGEKTTQWTIEDLKCPTEESPYIFTNYNSGYYGSGGLPTTTAMETTTSPETTTKITSTSAVKTTQQTTAKPDTTTTTTATTTTTTTKPGVVVTSPSDPPPAECRDVCVEPQVDDWIISAMCILSGAVLAQTLTIYTALKSKKQIVRVLSEKL